MRAYLAIREKSIRSNLKYDPRATQSRYRYLNLQGALEEIANARAELTRFPKGARLAYHTMLVQLYHDAPDVDVAHLARRQHQDAGKGTARTKREKAKLMSSAIADLIARNPALTNRAAARSYLQKTQSREWNTWTDTERKKKVTALLKQIYRAKKNSGH